MEDGVKEDPAQNKEPKFLGKAGWLKKSQGRLLTSYKDRYIHVEKTELVVYENEDLQNCLERLDLENYDKCHELKSPFTKKPRLILIRSSKSGHKVHDLKFQAPTAEERDAWIKALSDGINRAKNKVFDEVKVDDSSNLEHVTRTRPKGNRNRRPPTRIHMKEVADVSSDGILRLDLDLENAVMPNGNVYTNVDGKEAKVPAPLATVSEAAEEPSEGKADAEAPPESQTPKKKVIKPPMPPTKEAKPSSAPEEDPDNKDGSENKDLKPPMPPSKEVKPSPSSAEETTEEAQAEKTSEKKKAGPPPTPPNKPTSQTTPHPPTPPCKEKKPSPSVSDPGKGTEDNRSETTGEAKETDQSVSKEMDEVSEKETGETLSRASNELLLPVEVSVRSSSPAHEGEDSAALLQTAPDNSGGSIGAEEKRPKSEAPSVVSVNDPFSDDVSLKAEEKSVDSGQHSDSDSEASESEDPLAASTAAMRGSQAALDVLDGSEDNVRVNSDFTQVTVKQQVKVVPWQRSVPVPPAKPSLKIRSASIGDLLSDSALKNAAGAESNRSATDDVIKLETEVAMEMEKTSKLLSRVSETQEGGSREKMPEDLLTKAMEKLKMADHVLREVKKLKLAKDLNNRKSW